VREVSADHTATFHRGGHQPHRPDEGTGRQAGIGSSTSPASAHRIDTLDNGGLRLGATVTNADTAYHEQVERQFRSSRGAILSGASAQLRNMATNRRESAAAHEVLLLLRHGDALQQTRPGAGCFGDRRFNRMHAILGDERSMHRRTPVGHVRALAALEAVSGSPASMATARFRSPSSIGFPPMRRISTRTWRPANHHVDRISRERIRQYYAYLKVAIVLVRIRAGVGGGGPRDGRRHDYQARIALGGVAAQTWRNTDAEAMLTGLHATKDHFEASRDSIVRHARGFGPNTFH